MDLTFLTGSTVIMVLLGIIFGIGLALASKRFAVHVDPKVEALDGALPQLNCAACGYSGCLDYAKAVAAGGVSASLCVPGGKDVAEKLSTIAGIPLEEIKPVRAFVFCQGGRCEANDAFDYHGELDCRAAILVHGGPKQCKHGCLGFGTCTQVCPTGAISITEDRLPLIDLNRCTGCGICVKACPTKVIKTLPLGTKVYLGCSSPERGAIVKKKCSVGCISCRACVKATPSGAIVMEKEDPLPKLNYDIQESFEGAYEKCPMHCFVKASEDKSVDFEAQTALRTPKEKPAPKEPAAAAS